MYAKGKGAQVNYEQAAYWFHEAARQGNSVAEFSLGVMYSKGLGVPQDLGIALSWYLKAAEKGNEDARHNVRIFYDMYEYASREGTLHTTTNIGTQPMHQ